LKVLVAFASKHGSTWGIAEFIGEKLRQRGLDVDVLDITRDEPKNLGNYDAFVLGSALFFGHWMKEARKFVSRNKSNLSKHPTWLFSSGPTGKERKDSKGRDLLDPSVSGPFELQELKSELEHVRDHRVFFGSFDTNHMGFFTRQLMKSSTIREATPIGDFRDWNEIDNWTSAIWAALKPGIAAVAK
jgi:menaquinone-dependent protoporphyrinogen oxidase